MRIIGKDLKQVVVDVVPIFRGDNKIHIKVQSVHFGEEFDKLCLRPEPPTLTKKDGSRSQDFKDKEYAAKISEWLKRRNDYLIIKSLACNDDLEWDLVNMQDPATWSLWADEMEESGLTQPEINMIINKIMDINNLNDEKIEEARKSFLADMQAQQAEQS